MTSLPRPTSGKPCRDCCEEPRASRAPEGHVAVDPLFLYALREIPKEAVEEKEEN